MLKKNKIMLAVSIIAVVALTLGLVLGGLDRLDVEKYGINYNYITANFSDQIIYQGGLNFVGPSNVLLEIPKTYQRITLKNLKTFTQDFFPLQISAEAQYIIDLSPFNESNAKFNALRDFYVNFGGEPEKILKPLMQNQIIKAGSKYPSSWFQNASNYKTLEDGIQTSLYNIFLKWSNIKVKILLSSVVCKGVTFNLQSLNRKISGLTSQSQRMQARKTDMTNFINSLKTSSEIKMRIIKEAVGRKVSILQELKKNQYLNSSIILSAVEAVRRNLSFASSQLLLRPELYLISNTSLF